MNEREFITKWQFFFRKKNKINFKIKPIPIAAIIFYYYFVLYRLGVYISWQLWLLPLIYFSILANCSLFILSKHTHTHTHSLSEINDIGAQVATPSGRKYKQKKSSKIFSILPFPPYPNGLFFSNGVNLQFLFLSLSLSHFAMPKISFWIEKKTELKVKQECQREREKLELAL